VTNVHNTKNSTGNETTVQAKYDYIYKYKVWKFQ